MIGWLLYTTIIMRFVLLFRRYLYAAQSQYGRAGAVLVGYHSKFGIIRNELQHSRDCYQRTGVFIRDE